MEKIIERINELAKKKKLTGLSDAEKEEQYNLRKKYLEIFRGNFESHLATIKIVNENGDDVTPAKLKELKERKRA